MPLPIDELVGQVIDDDIVIHELLGEGGMGLVYRATQRSLKRELCLKFMHPHMISGSDWRQRFKREARTLSGIRDEHIVRVYFVGVLNGAYPYMAMELAKGRSLRAVIATSGGMDVRRTCKLHRQVCDALGRLHEKGFVHRDLKPDNIMICDEPPNESVKILDFGLCTLFDSATDTGRLTQTADVIGSPHYMAPECFSHSQRSPAVDVYAIGCTIYESLTGTPPYMADSVTALAIKHAGQSIPELPEQVGTIEERKFLNAFISKACAKDPADRFKNCAVMADLLSKLGDDLNSDTIDAHLRISGPSRTATLKDRTMVAGALVTLLFVSFLVIALVRSAHTETRRGSTAVSQQLASRRNVQKALPPDRLVAAREYISSFPKQCRRVDFKPHSLEGHLGAIIDDAQVSHTIPQALQTIDLVISALSPMRADVPDLCARLETRKAELLLQLGQTTRASHLFLSATRTLETSVSGFDADSAYVARLGLLESLLDCNNLTEAKLVLQKCLETAPRARDKDRLQLDSGIIYWRTDHQAQAKQCFKQYFAMIKPEIDALNSGVVRPQTWENIATAHGALGNREMEGNFLWLTYKLATESQMPVYANRVRSQVVHLAGIKADPTTVNPFALMSNTKVSTQGSSGLLPLLNTIRSLEDMLAPRLLIAEQYAKIVDLCQGSCTNWKLAASSARSAIRNLELVHRDSLEMRVLRARCLAEAGDRKESEVALPSPSAYTKIWESPQMLTQIQQAYMRNGHTSEALRVSTRKRFLLKSQHVCTRPDQDLWLAQILIRDKQWKEAETLLADISEPSLKLADIHGICGVAYAWDRERNPDKSETWLKKAVAIDPKSSDAVHALATVYASHNKLTDAAIWLEKAIDLHRDPSIPINQLTYVYLQLGDSNSCADAERMLKKHPLSITAGPLAQVYIHQRRFIETERLLKDYLASNSGKEQDLTLLDYLSLACLKQGKYEEAKTICKKILKICEEKLTPKTAPLLRSPVCSAIYRLIEIEFHLGHPEIQTICERELTNCEKVLDAHDQFVIHGLGWTATAYERLGKFSEAEALWRKALALCTETTKIQDGGPESVWLQYGLAETYWYHGKNAAAVDVLKKATANVSTNKLDVSFDALARMYCANGKLAEAEFLNKAQLKTRSQNPMDLSSTNLSGLGDIYANRGQLSKAEDYYKKALALDAKASPDYDFTTHISSLEGLAGLHSHRGCYEEAEAMYRQTLSLREQRTAAIHPALLTSLSGLADACFHNGKYAESRRLYQRAQAISERNPGTFDPGKSVRNANLIEICMREHKLQKAEQLRKTQHK